MEKQENKCRTTIKNIPGTFWKKSYIKVIITGHDFVQKDKIYTCKKCGLELDGFTYVEYFR